MIAVFPVRWRRLWLHYTIYMSASIVLPIAALVAFTWMTKGYDETFRHVSPATSLLAIPAVLVFCAVLSLAVAALCRMMSVELTQEHLVGRDYWGRRRRLPLNAISQVYRFEAL